MPRRPIARTVGRAISRAPSVVRRLTVSELLLLAEAPIALPLSALALRRYGLRRVQHIIGRHRAQKHAPAKLDRSLRAAQRLAWVVQAAAAYGPWPANCLQRSVVLWWYLRRRGLNGDLRIGVRRDPESAELVFHAWMEYDGVVLNDEPDIRTMYATFERPIAPRNATFR